MGARVITWLVYALLGLLGSAHAGEETAPGPTSATPPVSQHDGEAAKKESRETISPGDVPVDEEMLEYLDVLVELKVLDSLETIEALQAGEEDEP